MPDNKTVEKIKEVKEEVHQSTRAAAATVHYGGGIAPKVRPSDGAFTFQRK